MRTGMYGWRTGDGGHTLKEQEFKLDRRKSFFTVRTVKQLTTLSREIVPGKKSLDRIMP